MKKERIIESIIALVFGLTILLTAIFTNAGVAIIVLGSLLTAAGIGCLIWAIADKEEESAKIALRVVEDTKPVEKEETTKTVKKTTSKKTAKNK